MAVSGAHPGGDRRACRAGFPQLEAKTVENLNNPISDLEPPTCPFRTGACLPRYQNKGLEWLQLTWARYNSLCAREKARAAIFL
jgi:hypothetical protein